VLLSSGLFLAPAIEQPWQLYAKLGVLVGGGANMFLLIIGCCAASAAAIWIAAPRRVENLRELRFGFRNALLAFSKNGK
jgi:hypothetical protein